MASRPFAAATAPVRPAAAYLVGPESYGTFRMIAELQKAGAPVYRASKAFDGHAPGTWVIPASAVSQPIVEKGVKTLGLTVTGVDRLPAVDGERLKPATKVGLYRAANNMPGGWSMWMLEQYGINHTVMSAKDFAGDLNQQYDVILLPSGTTKARLLQGLDPKRHDPAEWAWAYGIGEAGWAKLRTFVQNGGTRVPLSASTVAELAALTGPRFLTVRLDGLGPYRLYASIDPLSGSKTVVGLPATLISGPLVRLALSALALIVVALLLAFFVTRTVVQRSLRPLQRLASTAHEVSRLELHTGEVEVPVRVKEGDSDPRSEVGQVGLAFNHMLDNVEGALSARHASEMKVRQFVADASHELRNPLASIRGYAELTRRERDTVSPTLSHALVRIESESDRMSRLVEDLLLLARLDSGPALDLKPLDLTEVVLNAISDARVAGTDHEWTLRVPDEPVMAKADRYRLHQVVANLLANARTHTPAGSRVGASLVTDADWAVISITDNGPGIPATLLPHVFERFADHGPGGPRPDVPRRGRLPSGNRGHRGVCRRGGHGKDHAHPVGLTALRLRDRRDRRRGRERGHPALPQAAVRSLRER